jgi:hypothetical protein
MEIVRYMEFSGRPFLKEERSAQGKGDHHGSEPCWIALTKDAIRQKVAHALQYRQRCSVKQSSMDVVPNGTSSKGSNPIDPNQLSSPIPRAAKAISLQRQHQKAKRRTSRKSPCVAAAYEDGLLASSPTAVTVVTHDGHDDNDEASHSSSPVAIAAPNLDVSSSTCWVHRNLLGNTTAPRDDDCISDLDDASDSNLEGWEDLITNLKEEEELERVDVVMATATVAPPALNASRSLCPADKMLIELESSSIGVVGTDAVAVAADAPNLDCLDDEDVDTDDDDSVSVFSELC